MTGPAGAGRLFEVVPSLAEVEDRLAAHRRRREALTAELVAVDERLNRLIALLHALRVFAGDFSAATTAAGLAEGGWSGTGEQLVAVTRAVLATTVPPADSPGGSPCPSTV